MIKTMWGLGVAGLLAVSTIGVFGLSATGSAPLRLDRLAFDEPEGVPGG